MPSHQYGSTTLGVGVADYWKFHDEAKDYEDFVTMYSRWLDGPKAITSAMSLEEARAEKQLNWRVFGKAEPTWVEVLHQGWRPNQHQGPLGLWDVQRIDVTGIPEALHRDHMDDLHHGRIPSPVLRDYWGIKPIRTEEWRERTLSDLWAKNVITDNGATAMLKNTWNNAGSAIAIYNHLGIAFGNRSYATLTTGIAASTPTVTTLACTGGVQVANMPASSPITVSYGTANAETFTTGATTPGNIGATSITVGSQTSVNAHSVNDWIVTQPAVSDNPASVANTADSGVLPGGDFVFSGTGAGNRQVVISFTYTTSTAAGAYTEAYTGNAATIAAGTTGSHLIFPPQTINSTTSLAITITEKV